MTRATVDGGSASGWLCSSEGICTTGQRSAVPALSPAAMLVGFALEQVSLTVSGPQVGWGGRPLTSNVLHPAPGIGDRGEIDSPRESVPVEVGVEQVDTIRPGDELVSDHRRDTAANQGGSNTVEHVVAADHGTLAGPHDHEPYAAAFEDIGEHVGRHELRQGG